MNNLLFPNGCMTTAADMTLEAPFAARRSSEHRFEVLRAGIGYISDQLDGTPSGLSDTVRGLEVLAVQPDLDRLVETKLDALQTAKTALESVTVAGERLLGRFSSRKPENAANVNLPDYHELAILGLFAYGRTSGILDAEDYLIPATSVQRTNNKGPYNFWGRIGGRRLYIDTTHPGIPDGQTLGIKPFFAFKGPRTGRDRLAQVISGEASKLEPSAIALKVAIEKARKYRTPMSLAEQGKATKLGHSVPTKGLPNRAKTHFR